MAKTKFLFFVLALFLFKVLALPVLGWQAPVDFFAVFILAFVFFDKEKNKDLLLAGLTVVFFDFFSGGTFGAMSAALILAVLAVFLMKKYLLILEQSHVLPFLTIFLCYQLYRLTFLNLERLIIGHLPTIKILNFYSFLTLGICIVIFNHVFKQKRI